MEVHHDISRLTDGQFLDLLLQFKQEANKTLVLQSASDARIKQIKKYIQNHQILYPIHLHNQTPPCSAN